MFRSKFILSNFYPNTPTHISATNAFQKFENNFYTSWLSKIYRICSTLRKSLGKQIMSIFDFQIHTSYITLVYCISYSVCNTMNEVVQKYYIP